MQLGRRRSATGASGKVCLIFPVLCALNVAGCNTTSQHASTMMTPHGATVAFDSIDGPPRATFDKLVQDLNAEAQARRLAVVSRESMSAYRVRGYLGAVSSKKQNTVSWVWDVYDRDKQRVLRINGEEKLTGKHKDAWQGLDDAATRRIAQASIEQLATFLAASDAVPPALPAVAYGGDASPEASGIFRMPQGKADPVSTQDDINPDPSVPLPGRRQRAANTTYQIPSEPPKGTN
jgi:hypothetical protein